jgi:hypothetical protein
MSEMGWRRRTNVWREVTSPPPGAMLPTSHRQRGAIPPGVCEFGKTRCGVSTAGLSSPFTGTNMSWHYPDLYLFLSLLAGFAGYHLRMHPKAETGPVEEGKAARPTPEQAEKPLPTEAHTRRSSAARTAVTNAPLAKTAAL